MNVDEYSNCEPDKIVLCNPNRTLQVLNENYSGGWLASWEGRLVPYLHWAGQTWEAQKPRRVGPHLPIPHCLG